MDSARVIAITGLTFHDLIDTGFMQDVNTVELMKGVALYNTASAAPGMRWWSQTPPVARHSGGAGWRI